MYLSYAQNMKLIKNLILNIVISAALLYACDHYWLWIKIEFLNQSTDTISVSLIWTFLLLWLIFWLFNSPIKRILKTLSCPVNFITLWLASLAINVLVFYMFAYFANQFFDWELLITLWEIRQTLILSFIITIGTTILKKIL